MCRYIFALFLLNFSYHSFGVPIPSKAPVVLMNLLTTLSDSCENKFLSDQIKIQLENCADMASLHKDKQLQCFLFYDISKQLCSSAVTNSKLAGVEDYAAQINEVQDVNLLCGSANDWVFSNLTEYPHYKHTAETIFKHTTRCLKICSVEDLLSDDANFYCKYFEWGTDILKNHSLGLSSKQVESAQVLPETGNIEKKPLELDNALSDKDVQIRKITTSASVHTSEAASVRLEEIPETEVVKPETSSNNNPEAEPSGNSALFEKANLKPDDRKEPIPVAEDPLAIIQADKPANTTNKDQKPDSPDTTLSKPESEITKKSDVDKEIVNMNDELKHKEKAVLETPVDPGQSKPKPPIDAEDYQDTDEGNGDIDVNDAGEDPVSVDVNKINKLDQPKEEEEETNKRKTIYSDIKGESSIYPNFGQEGYTADDDDDHFFSFFLTAVIMVALIYILYHNKNKVGKVFFGLILEGRQSGRRRDSRGHAYRRLDTLEQAMSTNSAAPPSKIIY